MRMYAADIARSLRTESATFFVIGLLALLEPAVTSFRFVACLWLVALGIHRLLRARRFDHTCDGYVDISPGIQVVTLREDRDRTREPAQPTQN